jgi:hypothetical protein
MLSQSLPDFDALRDYSQCPCARPEGKTRRDATQDPRRARSWGASGVYLSYATNRWNQKGNKKRQANR